MPGSSFRWKRISSELGGIAAEFSSFQFSQFHPGAAWEPSLNAYCCNAPDGCGSIEICIDLAGVAREAIELEVRGRQLVLRGERELPQPRGEMKCRRILTMEIENGRFERTLDLPEEVDAQKITARQENGLLWVHLPVRKKES